MLLPLPVIGVGFRGCVVFGCAGVEDFADVGVIFEHADGGSFCGGAARLAWRLGDRAAAVATTNKTHVEITARSLDAHSLSIFAQCAGG